jgi:hypothetical protein
MSVVRTLLAAEPLTLAATYDKLWVSEIVISADDPTADAVARVKPRRFRTADGRVEFSPEPPIWPEVDGLLAAAATDSELAGVVAGLMGYVARVGIANGIVAEA